MDHFFNMVTFTIDLGPNLQPLMAVLDTRSLELHIFYD